MRGNLNGASNVSASMKSLILVFATLGWACVSLAQDAPTGRATVRPLGPLRVQIETPTGGIVDGATVELLARVSDPSVLSASMLVNGATYDVPVEGGQIRQTVVASPGNNRVGIVVQRGSEVARDSVTFRHTGDSVQMMIVLTWPSTGEIIDLWVREPGGETCKWDHRETRGGGSLLDFSQDAIGFGSQAYVLSTARAGRFRVKVHYWAAASFEDSRGWGTYEEMLEELERIDTRLREPAPNHVRLQLTDERSRLLQRLDAWSAPAAQQTPVHAEVVLFPGTRAERRWRFDLLAQRDGQLLTLGEVEITDAMIAAAHTEQP